MKKFNSFEVILFDQNGERYSFIIKDKQLTPTACINILSAELANITDETDWVDINKDLPPLETEPSEAIDIDEGEGDLDAIANARVPLDAGSSS